MNPIIKILLIGFITCACSSLKVNTDFDRKADFGQYRTFTFDEDIKYLPLNEVNKRRIVEAITYELELKGLYRQREAELAVDFFVRPTPIDNQNHFATPYKYQWSSDFTTAKIDEADYGNGTIFIDIIDLQRRRLIWQGRGIQVLDGNQEIRESKINNVVEKILKIYPPEFN